MILLGKGKATLFSGRVIGSRSSKRLKARMIGGRVSCVVSKAAFLRITVNSKTDADAGELEWPGIAFRIRVGKRSIKAVIISRTVQNRKLRLGSTKRGIGRAYEALKYTMGVYLSRHNTVAVALAGLLHI
jgi:hypothetical protein